MKELTQEYLQECYTYDFDTGKLYLKRRPKSHFESEVSWLGSIRRVLGKDNRPKEVGTFVKDRLKLGLNGKLYYVHKIIFLLVHGYSPKLIAHFDGKALNNRISNLIDSTQADNMKLQHKRTINTSGVPGIYWVKPRGKWSAAIKVNYKKIHLGYFKLKEDAIEARKEAEIKHGFVVCQ